MKNKKLINKGIIGKKLGMTQIFDEKGNVIPVTLIEAGPCAVAQVKTVENDGYNALQLAFEDVKKKNVNKAQLGHFEKAKLTPKRHLKEFRLKDVAGYEAGSVVTVDTFTAGEKVDITGITKGRGFTGCVKRWGHTILRMTHGTGPIHRQCGSMGPISDPSRVYKNKKMAGQYGNEQVTILNLVAVKIDAEKNIIAVKGAVPGSKGGIVFLRDSVKA